MAAPRKLEDSAAVACYVAQHRRVPRSFKTSSKALVAVTPPAERATVFAVHCMERMSKDLQDEGKCEKCMLQFQHCICKEVACLASELDESCIGDQVRFVVWIHPKERPRGSNTGKLVEHIMPGSEVLVHQVPADVNRFQELVAAAPGRVVVLFPGVDAVPATPALLATGSAVPAGDGSTAAEQVGSARRGPLLVVLIDGTWRQAYRMRKIFEGLPTIALVSSQRSEFHWRRQSAEGRISTVEAAALLLEDLGFPRTGAPCLLRIALDKLNRALEAQTHYDTMKVPDIFQAKMSGRLPKRRPGCRPACQHRCP